MLKLDDQDRIIIYTGPDGSGRNSIALAVGQTFGMEKIVSYVTRSPRQGEIDGQDYHFISKEAYLRMEQQGEFLESIEFDGHLYGVRSSDVEENLRNHDCVYLVLNREGAEDLKQLYGDKAIRIFLFADRATVEERNRAQGMDDDVIARRMAYYDDEMAYRSSCEHSFENIILSDTISRITETLEGYLQRDLVEKD